MAHTLKARIRALEAELQAAQTSHEYTTSRLRDEVATERTTRIAAQQGLTPYVYAVQALNAWLGDRPELLNELSPILGELGLLGVRVGYDPQRDLSLSIIDGRRRKTA